MSSNGSGEEEENGRVAGINKGNQQSRLTRSFSASKVFSFRNLLMSIQTNMPAFAAKKGIPAALNFWRERKKKRIQNKKTENNNRDAYVALISTLPSPKPYSSFSSCFGSFE